MSIFTGYIGLCGDFMNARNKGLDLVNNILDVTEYAPGTKTYRFNDKRMGTIPFTYYNFNGQLDVFTEVGLTFMWT